MKSRNERFLLCDFEDIIENINALVVLGCLSTQFQQEKVCAKTAGRKRKCAKAKMLVWFLMFIGYWFVMPLWVG